MGVEQEAVCMSFGHTLERACNHARSSQLNFAIINCNNIADLAIEYFYGDTYFSADSSRVHT